MKPTEMTNLEYQEGGKSSVQDFTSSDRGKPWQQSNFFLFELRSHPQRALDLEYQNGGDDYKI